MRRKLKVAVISKLSGGLGHYVMHLYRPLSKYVDLKVITYFEKDILGMKTAKVTDTLVARHIPRPKFLIENTLESLAELEKYIVSREFDVVNIQVGTTARSMAPYFITLVSDLRRHRIPVVYTIHDVVPLEPFEGGEHILQIMYQMGDFFLVGNEEEKKKLIGIFKIPKDKIMISKHGIYSMFDLKNYNHKTARRALGLAPNKKIILFFGFLRPYKGLKYLLRAVPEIHKKIPNVLLYISSSLKFAKEVDPYLKEVQELGIERYVQMDFSYIPSDQIEPLFKSVDVVALPYLYLGQSGILQLAFAFKKPVVVTEAFFEASKIDGRIGYVVPPKDPKALARAIVKLLENKSLAEKMGRAGYTFANREHTWAKAAMATYKSYLKLVKARK